VDTLRHLMNVHPRDLRTLTNGQYHERLVVMTDQTQADENRPSVV
jgi:hypothetical protein